ASLAFVFEVPTEEILAHKPYGRKRPVLASLAFVFEVPTEEILAHKPYGRKRPVLSRTMMKNIIGHAIYQLAVMVFILFAEGPKVFNIDDGRPVGSIYEPSQHFTMIFNVLNSILMTCHISKRDGRSVYELTSSVDLDTEEQ
ncbi:unnamed protein product, partial [Rotaria sp. Silwood2]